LLALVHAVFCAVDLRVRLAEDLDEGEHHHRAWGVARIGGCLRAILTEERATGLLRNVLEDAPEHRAMLASLARRDLTDLLREMPALVCLAIVPEVTLRSGERA